MSRAVSDTERVGHVIKYSGPEGCYVVERITHKDVFFTDDAEKAQAYIDRCAKNRHPWGKAKEADQSNSYKECQVCGAVAWD